MYRLMGTVNCEKRIPKGPSSTSLYLGGPYHGVPRQSSSDGTSAQTDLWNPHLLTVFLHLLSVRVVWACLIARMKLKVKLKQQLSAADKAEQRGDRNNGAVRIEVTRGDDVEGGSDDENVTLGDLKRKVWRVFGKDKACGPQPWRGVVVSLNGKVRRGSIAGFYVYNVLMLTSVWCVA